MKPGEMKRFKVLYHSSAKVPLDLIAFHGKGYKDTWYLLVARDTPMSKEEFDGDDPAPRLTRLLTAFSLCYLLCLALSAVKEADAVRVFVEIPRRRPRPWHYPYAFVAFNRNLAVIFIQICGSGALRDICHHRINLVGQGRRNVLYGATMTEDIKVTSGKPFSALDFINNFCLNLFTHPPLSLHNILENISEKKY